MLPRFLIRSKSRRARSSLAALRSAAVLLATALFLGGSIASAAPSIEAQLDAGLEALIIYDYSNAYTDLRAAYERMEPDDPRWPMTAYAYALSAWHKSPPDLDRIAEAEAVLLKLAERMPNTEIAASALLDVARIAEVRDTNTDEANLDRARELYEQVRAAAPGTEMSARATLFLAQINAQSLETSDVEAAIELLQEELEQSPFPEWDALLAYYTGYLYEFYLQQPEAALPFFNITRKIGYPNKGTADRQLWQFSLVALETGNDSLAAEILTELGENFPRSSFRWAAEQQLAAIRAEDSESMPPADEPDTSAAPQNSLETKPAPAQ